MAFRFNALTGKLDVVLDLTAPLQFKGAITLASDFPTLAEVQGGWFYTVLADVTDDDPSKTYTGATFNTGDEIAWDGASAWVKVGSQTVLWENIEGTQSTINLSGFTNDAGFLTYSETISYADNANYATSAGSAGDASYASSAGTADYVNYENDPTFGTCPYDGSTYGWNNGAWTIVAGDTTFTDWRGGTAYSPVGPCEFNDGASKYARYANFANGDISEFSDGVFTYKIGQTSGATAIVSSATDSNEDFDANYVSNITAGSLIPQKLGVIRDATDSVITAQILERETSGTAEAGIGVGKEFKVENGSGNKPVAGKIEVVLTDVTDGAEYGQMAIKIIKNGVETTQLIIKSNGTINLPSLPTSSSGLSAGDLYSDSNVVKVV